MKSVTFSAFAMIMAIVPSAAFAGSVVVTTPGDQSNIHFDNGAASHVTSQYSAQVNDVFAAPGMHITVTPNGTKVSTSNGQTSTITVVGK